MQMLPPTVMSAGLRFHIFRSGEFNLNLAIGILGLFISAQITHKTLGPGRTGFKGRVSARMFAFILGTI
jgi:hypothetical protein